MRFVIVLLLLCVSVSTADAQTTSCPQGTACKSDGAKFTISKKVKQCVYQPSCMHGCGSCPPTGGQCYCDDCCIGLKK
jgi:hypothetical protein